LSEIIKHFIEKKKNAVMTMNKAARKRLCWNCEGSVSIAEETCPFCGVSVVPAFLEGTILEGANGSDFIPPYSSHASHSNEFDIPKSPYGFIEEDKPLIEEEQIQKKIEEDDQQPSLDEFKRVVTSVTLLLGGSVFFLFSLALLFFSHHGVLTLHWNGDVWFIYILLALPMLIFGWRSLMKLDA
jgi:hypothetical protein